MTRITLGALTVIDVHARDTVQQLVNSNISSSNDFQWISQLRYYYHDETVYVRMITTEVEYGYEYLGMFSYAMLCYIYGVMYVV